MIHTHMFVRGETLQELINAWLDHPLAEEPCLFLFFQFDGQ